jgi:hypothetical protein
MATITVKRTGYRWLVVPTYSVIIEDATGKIGFHGYGNREARALAATIGPLVGDRPVRELSKILAEEVLPSFHLAVLEPGEEWRANI